MLTSLQGLRVLGKVACLAWEAEKNRIKTKSVCLCFPSCFIVFPLLEAALQICLFVNL